jgi:hypothetical protein
MSTTSSVAQFMALIAGTQPPSTLRVGQNLNGETSQGTGHFQTILSGAQSNIVSGQTQTTQITPQMTSELSGDTSSPSSIWQFITQNGANDGAQSNLIVLDLAQQGASDQVIQELMATFTDTEIVTILQDPELKTELTNIINQVNNADGTTDTEAVVNALQSLVIQKQNSVEKLTFKQSDITDEIVSDIITKDIQPENDEELVVIALETQSVILKTPVQTAQTPEQSTTALQNTPEASRRLNPFMTKSEQATSPELKEIPTQVLNNTSAGNNKPDYQSIADRVNAHALTNANKNAAFNAESFNAIIPGGNGAELLTDGESVIPFEAGFKTITQATNALINNASAGQSHPATQAVALSLTKFAQTGKAGETDRYRLQLDPPEMGRLDIEMDFLDGGKVKTVIMVDKPETLAMLQKDMNTLIKAMQDAGFENMSQNDLSFSLSQDNNAGDHANNKGNNGHGQSSSDMIDGDLHVLESEMSVIIDPITGQKHVNMLV